MKQFPAKCKICKIDLTLSIADDYPAEKDPRNLIPMATCNRCFDLRERRIKIETGIKRICYRLELGSLESSDRAKLGDSLKMLAKKYSEWCADILRRQHAANVGYLASALIESPTQWFNHLKDFETAASQ